MALPATGMVVAAYLTDAAAQLRPDGRPQFGAATLTRWASSINQIHTAAGSDPPGRSEVVRRALAGVRRNPQDRAKTAQPALLADVRLRAPEPINPKTWAAPLFPPINQWGHLPLPIRSR